MLGRRVKEAYYLAAGPAMRLNSLIYRAFRAPRTGVVRAHLGPGQKNYLPGWFNVDANLFTAKIDIWADLRARLPFRNESVDIFYSHHVIEHFADNLLPRHFDELFRCLKPGGAIRIGGPNGDAAIRKFIEGDAKWFGDFPDKHESIGGRLVNFLLCRNEHLTILTESYLRELISSAGFVNVQARVSRIETGFPQWIDEAVFSIEWDDPSDIPHTLIIEASKPGGAA